MGYVTNGLRGIINLDTYVYSSVQGTLDSIKDCLAKGRISDAFTLLRKYYDSTIINVYSNLYLSDKASIENFVVEQIDSWIRDQEKLPEYRVMSQYIRNSDKLKPITLLLLKDGTYKAIRNRCNDDTHYNFFNNVLRNDSEVHLNDRLELLDIFSSDVEALFIQHLAYIFYLNDHYMASSDYTDYLEMDMTPPEDAQYWVAPIVQDVFTNVICKSRPDIADTIKKNTSMQLD